MSRYKRFDGKDPEERRKIIRKEMEDIRDIMSAREIIYEEWLKHLDLKGVKIGSTLYYMGEKICLN